MSYKYTMALSSKQLCKSTFLEKLTLVYLQVDENSVGCDRLKNMP